MTVEPFEIALPIEHLIKARLDEENAHEQGCEQGGKIFGDFFNVHFVNCGSRIADLLKPRTPIQNQGADHLPQAG
jgi:hypothetical protein